MLLSEKVMLECVKSGNVYDNRLDIQSKIDTMISELNKLVIDCVEYLKELGNWLEALEFPAFYYNLIKLAREVPYEYMADNLHEAIAEFTPPGMWFRSHPDRDWDIGFWPCDWFEGSE